MSPLPGYAETLRIATFHSQLTRKGPGLLLRDIRSGKDAQVTAVLDLITHVEPDILLLTDFDQDPDDLAASAMSLALEERGIDLGHVYSGPTNKGVPSGLDLDEDGRIGEPEDAIGYGKFYGNGGMAILSRFPIARSKVLDHATLLWSQLPNNLRIKEGSTLSDLPLSTSGHWLVPIKITDASSLSLAVFHATTPVFDGPEDRNGRRNHDEVALWRHILTQQNSEQIVLAGNFNIDPNRGEGRKEALHQLLQGPFQDPMTSDLPTVDWPENPGPGDLRVDYVLPATTLHVIASDVIWPTQDDPLSPLTIAASDHRLVWVDVEWP
ncbi:MAG: endonuclease/exonuclease/phosphatase family protein [Pseudoruegeria sp.]